MKLKLSAIVLLAMIAPAQTRAATLTGAEATFLSELVTAGTVLERRCPGFEANGAGGVRFGARLLGSPDAAMAMINAYDAAIKSHDGTSYDVGKFRPEVSEAAGQISSRVRADLIKHPDAACAHYGGAGVASGLLSRH
jgi:hypothetical protein